MFSFVTWTCFWDLSTLLHGSVACFFLFLSIPLYQHSTICLSIVYAPLIYFQFGAIINKGEPHPPGQ